MATPGRTVEDLGAEGERATNGRTLPIASSANNLKPACLSCQVPPPSSLSPSATALAPRPPSPSPAQSQDPPSSPNALPAKEWISGKQRGSLGRASLQGSQKGELLPSWLWRSWPAPLFSSLLSYPSCPRTLHCLCSDLQP